jgi:hypothetical protein
LLPVFVGFVAPSATVIINHEHSEFRWVSFDEALTMVPFAGQRHVKAEFVDREPVRHLLITSPSTACLDAEYNPIYGAGRNPNTELILTMRPERCLRIKGKTGFPGESAIMLF